MALTFPLSLEKVNDLLFIDDGVFTPSRNDNITGMGNNQPINAELASPLWRADISSGPILNDDAEAIAALLEILERPGNDFYICNPRKLAPRADPTGSILGAAIPTIHSINVNNHQMAFAALPNGYVLSQGDVFSFEYGPGGAKRRAYHRIAETVTAVSGITTQVEVFPHIRSGAIVGDIVTLIKPAMRAKLIPGSYRPSSAGGEYMRVSFSAIQKLI